MKRLLLTTALLALFAGHAQAVTVKMEDFTGVDGTIIDDVNPAFGSEGPVTLDWDPEGNDVSALRKWNGGYSGRDATYCHTGTAASCALDINVASGYGVTLSNFFLGAWPNTSRTIEWSVIDLLTNLVVASGAPLVSGSTGLVETIGLSSTKGFRILFGPDGYNGGMNDITYSYAPVSAVPLPGSLVLFGTAIAGLAAVRRRARHSAA